MEHGTVQMYRKELRLHRAGRGPEPCEACRLAQAQAIAGWRLLKPPRDRSTETRKATIRRRALNRLAEEYPARLSTLMAEESEDMWAKVTAAQKP